MDITIHPHALDNMVMSAVEVYKKEVFGLMFGFSRDGSDDMIVSAIHPLLTSERHFNRVYADIRKINKVIDLFEEFKQLRNMDDDNYTFLGTYHSHPENYNIRGIPRMSPVDENTFLNVKGVQINIIIAINDIRREGFWRENVDKTASGSIGSYHIKIAGFHKLNGRPGLAKIKINDKNNQGLAPITDHIQSNYPIGCGKIKLRYSEEKNDFDKYATTNNTNSKKDNLTNIDLDAVYYAYINNKKHEIPISTLREYMNITKNSLNQILNKLMNLGLVNVDGDIVRVCMNE